MNKKKKSAANSSIQIVFLTILIKLMAFLKQTVLASTFGTTVAIDLYLLSADTLGDFSLAVYSALSVSVMTLYLKYYENKNIKESNNVISTAFKYFVPLSFIFILVFFVFSDKIAMLLAYNYSYNDQMTVASYIRIICPTLLFLCLTYISSAVLDAHKLFWPGKMINFTLSVVIILATLIFGNSHSTKILAYSYSIAYFLHLLLIFFISKKYYNFEKVKIMKNKYIKSILIMFFPLFLGNAAFEISVLVDKLVVSSIGKGLISAQTFGSTLNSFVVSIFITAPIGVLLSFLSSYAVKEEKDKIIQLVEKSMIIFVCILLPISIITFFNADSIVRIVYQRGAFNEQSVVNTTLCLLGYSIGFVFTAVREILIKVHLAYRDGKTVMINGIISIVFNIICSIILAKKIGLIGISLGTSISTFLCMLLCFFTSKKYIVNGFSNKLKKEIIKLSVSSIVIIIINIILSNNIIFTNNIFNFLTVSSITFAIYLISLFILKSEVINYLFHYLKFKRGD